LNSDEVFEPTEGQTSGQGPNQVIQGFIGSMHSLHSLHGDKEAKNDENNSCLSITVGILKEMSDFSLLKESIAFFLIALSNFFVFSGFFTPFLYITKVAEENGIPKEKAAFLISIVGIVNIPTRMLFGFIADRRFISPINLNTFSISVSTIALFLYFKLQLVYWSQVIFAILLAIGIG